MLVDKHESFCSCYRTEYRTVNNKNNERIVCHCGEEHAVYDWIWDSDTLTKSAFLSDDKHDVQFHQIFSTGTAAVRGNTPFKQNYHYYWEIKMLTSLYGTDVMVGVGTDNVDVELWRYRFCSLLGIDNNSWGYSYRGTVQHGNKMQHYGPRFGLGSIIGVHLDMFSGTLEFYHNRKPLGVAFTGLKNCRLFPIVCSTAAQSAIRLTCAISTAPSLQLLCIQSLTMHSQLDESFNSVPGLRNMLNNRFWWLIARPKIDKKKEEHWTMEVVDDDSEDTACFSRIRTSHRKRKRATLKRSKKNCDSDTYSRDFESGHLSDGIGQSSDRTVLDSPVTTFAPCDQCGIVRAVVKSKRSIHSNNNRICLYCDVLL